MNILKYLVLLAFILETALIVNHFINSSPASWIQLFYVTLVFLLIIFSTTLKLAKKIMFVRISQVFLISYTIITAAATLIANKPNTSLFVINPAAFLLLLNIIVYFTLVIVIYFISFLFLIKLKGAKNALVYLSLTAILLILSFASVAIPLLSLLFLILTLIAYPIGVYNYILMFDKS